MDWIRNRDENGSITGRNLTQYILEDNQGHPRPKIPSQTANYLDFIKSHIELATVRSAR